MTMYEELMQHVTRRRYNPSGATLRMTNKAFVSLLRTMPDHCTWLPENNDYTKENVLSTPFGTFKIVKDDYMFQLEETCP